MNKEIRIQMKDITVEELKIKLDAKEEFVFIDVRESYEYDEFNLGATLIPLGSLMSNLRNLEPYKENEIIIHCRSGIRSGAAKDTLVRLGFKNVKNLLGGVLDWKQKFPNWKI